MADDTPDRVLNAAGPIFAREGYEGATVREICAAAGVNLASVNYHFGGKETLYLETVKLAHQQKLSRVPLPALPEEAGREQKLFNFIQTILNRLLGGGDSDWQTEVLIREMIRPTHACTPLVEDYIRPQFQLLLEIIDEFVPGKTPLEVRHKLGFSIVGQCLNYRVARGFVTLLAKPQPEDSLFDIEMLARHITQFSLAALSHWELNTTSDAMSAATQQSSRPSTTPTAQTSIPATHS